MEEPTKSDFEDLKRKNKLCTIGRLKDRVSSSISSLDDEIKRLENIQATMVELGRYLTLYSDLLERPESASNGWDGPAWEPYLEMLMELLEGLDGGCEEVYCIESFLKLAKG